MCISCSDKMHMVNMTSREASIEIAVGKAEIIGRYMMQVKRQSKETLMRALRMLDFEEGVDMQKTVEGLSIYINAVLNKYLPQYQQTPDLFFENSDKIKTEMRGTT